MPSRTRGKGPTPAELEQARGKTVPDLIAPDLRVLFCGINPSLYSAAVGHHFARPGNRFWPALHRAGFTPRVLTPAEERKLLKLGFGITNVASRATASASELDAADYEQGALALRKKVLRYRPLVVAFLGIGAYRTIANDRHAGIGRAAQSFAETPAWVLPNPSGLNAHYQLDTLAEEYAKLRQFVETLE